MRVRRSEAIYLSLANQLWHESLPVVTVMAHRCGAPLKWRESCTWLCKFHYKMLLNKLEEIAARSNAASLNSLEIKAVKEGTKIRVENRV